MVDQAKVGLSTFALKDKVMSLFCPCHDKEIHTVPRLLLLSWGCFFCILGTLGQQVWRHSWLPLVWEGLLMATSGWTEGMPLRTLRSRRALQRHLSELHTAAGALCSSSAQERKRLPASLSRIQRLKCWDPCVLSFYH